MNPHLEQTDPVLVELLNEGDQDAFEAIYRRYGSMLYGYINARIYEPEDSREMVQDVFESLWSRRGSLKISSLRHYLFSSVRYMIFRYIYNKGTRQRYIDHFMIFENLWYTMDDPEQESESLRDRILRALQGLPERCQMAIKMRLTENLSNSEIAERMNITKKTVELYMSKAMSHLRIVLKTAGALLWWILCR